MPIESRSRDIVCFANRRLGARVAYDLNSLEGVDLALVVIDSPSRADIDLSSLSNGVPIVSWEDFLRKVPKIDRTYAAGVSVLFGRLIPDSVVALFEDGIVNLHPSYLPHGRGKYPATWAIWEQSPYGASAHLVTSEFDAGPLLDQVRIPIRDDDTSESLYARGTEALWDLYLNSVRSWVGGRPVSFQEQASGGTSHTKADLEELQEVANASVLPIRDHVRLLRALSMGPGSGLVLRQGVDQVLVRVTLEQHVEQREELGQ